MNTLSFLFRVFLFRGYTLYQYINISRHFKNLRFDFSKTKFYGAIFRHHLFFYENENNFGNKSLIMDFYESKNFSDYLVLTFIFKLRVSQIAPP